MELLQSVDFKLLSEALPDFPFPVFPFDTLATELSALFTKKVTLSSHTRGWVPYKNGVAEAIIFTIYVLPLNEPLYFCTTKEDLRRVAAALFATPSPYLFEGPFFEGFCTYLAVAVLKEVEGLKLAEGLSFRLGETVKEIRGDFFTLDVIATLESNTLQGAVAIPAALRTAWKKHFLHKPHLALSEEIKKKVALELALEVGYVHLLHDNLRQLRVGDFVVLDHASYDPATREGSVVVKVQNTPVFRGKIQKNGIKILEYPRLEEEGEIMDEDENIEESAPVAIETLPVQVVVEVGRLKMTLQEFAALSTGSIIDLQLPLEQGVDLVVNGKKMGKGELVKIGEMVGLRVTSL